MSFSSEIKSELAKIDGIPSCCYHAQVYGLVLFAHFKPGDFSIKTENKDVFELYCDAVRNYVGVPLKKNLSGIKMLSAYIRTEENILKAFDKFGHSDGETTLRINHANFQNDCCLSAFLRGAFLACGSVSDPESSYHLEFVVPYKKLSQDLMLVLKEFGLNAKYIQRKGNHIVYFKDSENIEDFLTVIGAQNATLYLINVKIEKDVINNANRRVNLDIHNIDKAIEAADVQIAAIEKIINKYGDLSYLPDNLSSVARLRLENPEASLSLLQSLSKDKISKSGIKHRLDKIIEIAASIG